MDIYIQKINRKEPEEYKTNDLPDVRVDFDNSSSSHSLLSCRGSVVSLNRTLCRICQSDTGTMIRPCCCAGTMGKIHENCLNEWVTHSKKHWCEICKTEYAKSQNTFLPFRQWKKPNISSTNWIEFFALCGFAFSLYYMIALIDERQLIYRLIINKLPPREPDVCRIILLVLVIAFFIGTIMDLLIKVKFYIRNQCKIHFINKRLISNDISTNDLKKIEPVLRDLPQNNTLFINKRSTIDNKKEI